MADTCKNWKKMFLYCGIIKFTHGRSIKKLRGLWQGDNVKPRSSIFTIVDVDERSYGVLTALQSCNSSLI